MAALLATGCSAFDFDIEHQIAPITVEGDEAAAAAKLRVPFDIIPPFTIDYNERRNPAGIYMKGFSLSAVDRPMTAAQYEYTLAFIYDLKFTVRSTAPGSALPERVIAWTDGPVHSVTYVELGVDTNVDLLPYLKEGAEIRSSLWGIVPADTTTFSGKAVLGVDVF